MYVLKIENISWSKIILQISGILKSNWLLIEFVSLSIHAFGRDYRCTDGNASPLKIVFKTTVYHHKVIGQPSEVFVSVCFLAGLSRLQHLYEVVNSEELKIEIDVIRIINVENCYALLRQLDSRMPTGDKNIVLDLSTERSLELVLRQVGGLSSYSIQLQQIFAEKENVNHLKYNI